MADACWKMLTLVFSSFFPFPLHLPLPHVDGLFVYGDILGGDSKRDAFTVIGSNPNVMNVIMIKNEYTSVHKHYIMWVGAHPRALYVALFECGIRAIPSIVLINIH